MPIKPKITKYSRFLSSCTWPMYVSCKLHSFLVCLKLRCVVYYASKQKTKWSNQEIIHCSVFYRHPMHGLAPGTIAEMQKVGSMYDKVQTHSSTDSLRPNQKHWLPSRCAWVWITSWNNSLAPPRVEPHNITSAPRIMAPNLGPHIELVLRRGHTFN
jgi:hypothetical protein